MPIDPLDAPELEEPDIPDGPGEMRPELDTERAPRADFGFTPDDALRLLALLLLLLLLLLVLLVLLLLVGLPEFEVTDKVTDFPLVDKVAGFVFVG
jgi:hypothetical protein